MPDPSGRLEVEECAQDGAKEIHQEAAVSSRGVIMLSYNWVRSSSTRFIELFSHNEGAVEAGFLNV